MTTDYKGNGVSPNSAAYRTHSLRVSNGVGNIGITSCLAPAQSCNLLPDGLLKRGAMQLDGEIEHLAFTFEVVGQLFLGNTQHLCAAGSLARRFAHVEKHHALTTRIDIDVADGAVKGHARIKLRNLHLPRLPLAERRG